MRRAKGWQDRWRVSGQRIGVHVVVVGLHLGLLMSLLGDPFTSRQTPLHRAATARNAIRIRFVRQQVMAPEPPLRAPSKLPQSLPKRWLAGDAHARRAIGSHSKAPPSNYLPESVKRNATPADTVPTYIAGGGRFEGLSRYPRSNLAHLPGSSQEIVRNLHMIDPRMRGIGGAVLKLQTVFGVPDPHCVNVEGWRGMSVKELLDRHMSPNQVEDTAAEYHCGPPV